MLPTKDHCELVPLGACPEALQEARASTPNASALRVRRVCGKAFATVHLMADDQGPIVLTVGNNSADFGRARSGVLTISAHGTSAADLIAILQNGIDALSRAADACERAST